MAPTVHCCLDFILSRIILRVSFGEYSHFSIKGFGLYFGYDHKRQTFELMADSLLILIVKIVNWNVS